ncbi:Cysteine proteinases superfamily protein [Klebsormidium nitens]|uniref:Cysteine proteinases superfamily protein n=1 Tax=Klebsormidium nitens TaxID=105231 RepID=A0A1Y1HPD3_KLENI|nr:Cysteine proteinases superfamily protein [Klebsormidium nitens]|eukprot:GAQ79642.1 Cysteine proteinases superfamily protein [Klebsormidium nitens]
MVDFYSLYLQHASPQDLSGVIVAHPLLFDKLYRLFRRASLTSKEVLRRDLEKALKNLGVPSFELLFQCRALFLPAQPGGLMTGTKLTGGLIPGVKYIGGLIPNGTIVERGFPTGASPQGGGPEAAASAPPRERASVAALGGRI